MSTYGTFSADGQDRVRPKTRESFLPFALPDIGDDEIREVTETLRSGWVTTGAKTKHFEAEFAAAVDAKHAIAVNSCTAALHLSLEAAGLRQGDEVITTPYTFAASAEVIRYFDARPVLVDVDAESLNIRADLIGGRGHDQDQGHHPGAHRRCRGRSRSDPRRGAPSRPDRHRRRRALVPDSLQGPDDRHDRRCHLFFVLRDEDHHHRRRRHDHHRR